MALVVIQEERRKDLYNTLKQMPEAYKAGIYIRLSEADEGKSYEAESESVLNQRNILMNFIKEKGFIFTDEYVDGGHYHLSRSYFHSPEEDFIDLSEVEEVDEI